MLFNDSEQDKTYINQTDFYFDGPRKIIMSVYSYFLGDHLRPAPNILLSPQNKIKNITCNIHFYFIIILYSQNGYVSKKLDLNWFENNLGMNISIVFLCHLCFLSY